MALFAVISEGGGGIFWIQGASNIGPVFFEVLLWNVLCNTRKSSSIYNIIFSQLGLKFIAKEILFLKVNNCMK